MCHGYANLYQSVSTLGVPVFSAVPPPSLTPGEEDGVELEAASILQPTGQLTEVTAIQVQGDSQGLPAALHLVAHWCV